MSAMTPVTLSGSARGQMNASARPATNFRVMPQGYRGPEGQEFAIPLPQDRIIAEEVNLGLIRALEPPETHIGLQFAPWMDVPTDDVIFQYAKGAGTGLAPARAEDAESRLWQTDEFAPGEGRASLVDWALKNHYTSSDVMQYRGFLETLEATRDSGAFPFYVRSITDGFAGRLAREAAERRRRLDNRIEWLIISALSTGKIVYDDGAVDFVADYERPDDQQAIQPKSGAYNGTDHDPINDIIHDIQIMKDRYGVDIDRAVASQKFLNSLYKSSKFIPLTGFLPSTGIDTSDLPYLAPGFGPAAAVAIIERETGVRFIPYDSTYRAKVYGQNKFTQQRFMPENRVLFLPNEDQLAEYNNTDLGFGRTLTSPHPMGNFTPGFYSWEQESTDPWGHDVGTGVKAFPVFPAMETTFTWDVEL
jgi:hypothetical protein